MNLATAPVDGSMTGALLPLGYALALGLLVGLERGWDGRSQVDGARVAGIRTYGLLGLTGGVAALLPPWPGAIIIAIAALLLLGGYLRQSRLPTGRSATGAVAGLLVLGLGVLAARGQATVAAAAAAATMLLLASRKPLHGMLRGITVAELRAAARFALLALVLLPLAPDRALGPYAALNPRYLLLVVVLVCGLSFIAYLLARRTRGRGGTLIAAMCGAIVSSTAVTGAFARRMGDGQAQDAGLEIGIILASAVSVGRVLVLVALLQPAAFAAIATPLAPALLLLLASGWWAWRRPHQTDHAYRAGLGNPLELGGALSLAALTAVAIIASRWGIERFGHFGAAPVLTLIGLVDVDAAVLAFAAMPVVDQAALAGAALALPVAGNLLLKSALTITLARNAGGVRAAVPIALAAVAALGLLAVMNLV